jgi:hypothetical protein
LRIGKTLLPGRSRTVEITEGLSFVDWDVEGAVLGIDVQNWDRSSPVTVSLRQLSTPELGVPNTVDSRVNPDEQLPLSLAGLGFGNYELQARQRLPDGSTWISPLVSVGLEPGDPAEEVTLELGDYSAILRIHDPNGWPLRSARVRSSLTGRIGFEQIDAGVFGADAGRVGPGEPVLVQAPGFTPLCVRAPVAGSERRVDLRAGVSRALAFLGTSGLAVPPGRIQWSGTDCPVRLSRFTSRRTRSTDEASMSAFVLDDFPPDAALTFWASEEALPQQLAVDAAGVLRIPLASEGEGGTRRRP